jgi:hypothetical protein
MAEAIMQKRLKASTRKTETSNIRIGAALKNELAEEPKAWQHGNRKMRRPSRRLMKAGV